MAVQAPHFAAAAFTDLRHLSCGGVAGDMFGICIDEGQPPPAATETVSLLACGEPRSRKRGREMEAMPISSSAGNVRARTIGGSLAPSTSGRPDASGVTYLLRRQNLEIDALIRLQGERIRSAVEEERRRHCGLMVAALERRAAALLREKEAELAAASRRNADLAEKVRLAAAEGQIWRGVARSNEAVAAGLRSALDEALLRLAAAAEEGYGDSDDLPPAADGMSPETVEDLEFRRRRSCKSCGGGDARVLVLPCRHLCLCAGCEPSIDTCPVCRSVKNGILHVFLS